MDLENRTVKEIIKNSLRSIESTTNHVTAALVAIPVGTFFWVMTNDDLGGMVDFYRSSEAKRLLGDDTANQAANEWEIYFRSNSSLREFIKNSYDSFKPRQYSH